MTKSKSRTLAALLALVLSVAALVALPATAHAATGAVEINVSTLTADANNIGDAATDSQWAYNHTTKVLTLSTEDGNYTLRGTNADLSVYAINAVGASITLNAVDITCSTATPKAGGVLMTSSATITLVGDNYLNANPSDTAGADAGLLYMNGDLVITSSSGGRLYATGATGTSSGINHGSNASLSVTGGAGVYAEGNPGLYAGTDPGEVYVGPLSELKVDGRSGIDAHGIWVVVYSFTLTADGSIEVKGSGTGHGVFASVLTSELYIEGNGLFKADAGTLGDGIVAGRLFIEDCSVTAIGGGLSSKAVSIQTDIFMGDAAELSILHHFGSNVTYRFQMTNGTSDYLWKLQGFTFVSPYDELDSYIEVSLADGEFGIISREGPAVCKIVETSVEYSTLAAAVAAAAGGQTIQLLANVNENPSTWIEIDKALTIDMDRFNLTLTKGISVADTGELTVTYDDSAAGGELKALWITVEGSLDLTAKSVTLTGPDPIGFILISNGTGGIASATINADIYSLNSEGILVFERGEATVNGNITAASHGARAGGAVDATLTVNGDITTAGRGVYAYGAGDISVNGDITAAQAGVYVEHGGKVTVTGDIIGSYHGIEIMNGGTVSFTGNVKSTYYGVWAAGSYSVATIIGDIDSGDDGIHTQDGATVTVTGSIDSADDGIIAVSGSKVTVNGDVTAAWATYGRGSGTTLTVNGNITLTGNYSSLGSFDKANVTVIGDVSVLNLSEEDFYAVFATEDGALTIKGKVTSNKNGANASNGGQITIDGTLSIGAGYAYATLAVWDDTYSTLITSVDKSISQFTTPTTKAGFYTYTDGVSTVWVRDPATLPGGTAPTGDSAAWLLGAAVLLSALGALSLAARRSRRRVLAA